jgi:hypothetical protein
MHGKRFRVVTPPYPARKTVRQTAPGVHRIAGNVFFPIRPLRPAAVSMP